MGINTDVKRIFVGDGNWYIDWENWYVGWSD